MIDYLNPFSEALLTEFYTRKGETVPQAFERAAFGYLPEDKRELGSRILDYVNKGWFMFSSPVLSNAPLKGEKLRAMPISCYKTLIPDQIDGQLDASSEMAALSVSGGGIGTYIDVRAVSEKAPGPIPYIKTIDANIAYYRQSKTRKGSVAIYMEANHPDVVEFIKIRIPTGGDPARKVDNRKQVHNAICYGKDFVNAIDQDLEWPLIDPHSREVKDTIRARELWELILDTRALTGEPYLFHKDNVNEQLHPLLKEKGLEVKSSNLCVHGDTHILTNNGYFPIADLEGQSVTVWNGFEWSDDVVIRKTNTEQKLREYSFSNGQSIKCTDEHKFYINTSYYGTYEIKSAKDIKVGDKLVKWEYPLIEQGDLTLNKAYTNGFFTADGCSYKGNDIVYLYNDKKELCKFIEHDGSSKYSEKENRIVLNNVKNLKPKFFVPDSDYDLKSKISWFEGLSDGDGCLVKNGNNESLQIGSINLEFLKNVQLMLSEIGVFSKISKLHDADYRLLPKNDGSGELDYYNCKNSYRITIPSSSMVVLFKHGFSPKRLQFNTDFIPQRNAQQYVYLTEVNEVDGLHDTYCATEPKNNTLVFNGIMTGNCSEIIIPTDEKRTAVCCLSSVNLEFFDDWSVDDSTFIADCVEFLDYVLEYFIQNAEPHLKKAVYAAKMGRDLGLGAMGFHYYLQKNNIAFESGGIGSAVQANNRIFHYIKKEADKATIRMGLEKGQAPDVQGSMRRNVSCIAIAPNANSGSILNTSPSIDPITSNCFAQSTRVGTYVVRNKYLEKVLNAYCPYDADKETWLEEQWKSISQHHGSVQHLDYLSDAHKKIFKTAYEIDQHWVIQHAEDRAPYIDQSQPVNIFFPAGTDKAYFNSVHLKGIRSKTLKTMYYCRMEREMQVNSLEKHQREALVDWNDKEKCHSCEG